MILRIRHSAFTLIEREGNFRFSILDFRFPNDQSGTPAARWRGSAQSKIENPKSKISRARHGRGFTLIELLTVITIIGILAGILIPVTMRVRESARAATCLSNLRQIGVACAIWSAENKDSLVFEPRNFPVTSGSIHKWTEKIKPCINIPRSAAESTGGIFNCPSFRRTKAGGDYSINYDTGKNQSANADDAGTVSARKTPDFNVPSRKVYVLDSHRGAGTLASDFYKMPQDATHDTFTTHGYGYAAWRHSGKCNLLFIDGHVSALAFPPLPATSAEASGEGKKWFSPTEPPPAF
jgi:general secretion pathway protein G